MWDCVVKVIWIGEVDIDLFVEEFSGMICLYWMLCMISGGCFLGDMFLESDKELIDGFFEYYVCIKGFSGDYCVVINKIWGDVILGMVMVDVFCNYFLED